MWTCSRPVRSAPERRGPGRVHAGEREVPDRQPVQHGGRLVADDGIGRDPRHGDRHLEQVPILGRRSRGSAGSTYAPGAMRASSPRRCMRRTSSLGRPPRRRDRGASSGPGPSVGRSTSARMDSAGRRPAGFSGESVPDTGTAALAPASGRRCGHRNAGAGSGLSDRRGTMGRVTTTEQDLRGAGRGGARRAGRAASAPARGPVDGDPRAGRASGGGRSSCSAPAGASRRCTSWPPRCCGRQAPGPR